MSIAILGLLLAILPVQLGGESNTLHHLQAVQLAPEMGADLAPFSDHDGDGLGDYLVGAAGSAFLISGIDGQILLTLEQRNLSSFGSVVCRADDVDGDGVEDILIGAPHASPGGIDEAGSAFLYSGANGQLLYRWDGSTPYGLLGTALSPMPDLDGDGTLDLAIGAPQAGPQNRGKVFFYSGATGLTLRTLEGTPYDLFGSDIALADDLDFDGIPDLVVGVPGLEISGVSWGALKLYSGADGHLIRTIAGPCACRWEYTGFFGADIAMAEDMDGDGIQEIVVALADGNWAGWVGQGVVHVYSGATGVQLHNIGGFYDNHMFASAIAAVGDIDLDGKGDFVVLADRGGDSYLYSGTGSLIDTFSIGYTEKVTGTEDLDADGIPDMVLSSPGNNLVVAISGATRSELYRLERPSSYLFGSSIDLVGDVDGDGQNDVAVGDPDGGPQYSQGSITVYSGNDGTFLMAVNGPGSGARLGGSMLAAGDINGDGYDDFLAGAPGQMQGAGMVLAYSGFDGSVLFTNTGTAGAGLGQSLARLSDLNVDGFAEYLIGAPNSDTVQVHSGADGSFLWQVSAPQTGESFGTSVAAADVNQDGVRDLIVGAFLAQPWNRNWQDGVVYVYSGTDGSLLFRKLGPRNSGARLGLDVANAGDVDGDGVDDILAGAPNDSSGFNQQGSVSVWSGATSQLLHRFYGADQDMYIGNAVSTADDIDRDGYADLLLGSDAQGFLLYSGATGKLLHKNDGGTLQHRLGQSVANLGDLDGNGSPDFGVGAPYHAGNGIPGTAFIYDFAPFLSTDSYDLSLVSGGHLNLSLAFPTLQANSDYKVLVSTTGTGPTLYGVEIPLTPDAIARASFQGSYPFPSHSDLQGSLDAQGKATATIDLPAGLPSQLLGLRFWLAAVALTPGQMPEASSVALPFRIGP